MIVTMMELKDKYKNYADINGKIKRDVDNNVLFPIKRGLYETNKYVDGYLLASSIYGPSYLSFEYALSYYNLIPERVVTYTNATFNKQKTKKYQTNYGLFIYRDVPKEAFPYFIQAYEVDPYSYLIATPEKALCDMLYTLSPIRSIKELEMLLFDNLRIDVDEFKTLNFDNILFLSNKYASNNLYFLAKLIKRMGRNDNS